MQINKAAQDTRLVEGKLQSETPTCTVPVCTCLYAYVHGVNLSKNIHISMITPPVTRDRVRKAKRAPFSTQISSAFKLCLRPCCFHKKTYISTCFCWLEETQRGFLLLRKRRKAKLAFGVCSAAGRYRGGRSGATQLLPREPREPRETHSASQHPAARAVNCASTCALSRLILCICLQDVF